VRASWYTLQEYPPWLLSDILSPQSLVSFWTDWHVWKYFTIFLEERPPWIRLIQPTIWLWESFKLSALCPELLNRNPSRRRKYTNKFKMKTNCKYSCTVMWSKKVGIINKPRCKEYKTQNRTKWREIKWGNMILGWWGRKETQRRREGNAKINTRGMQTDDRDETVNWRRYKMNRCWFYDTFCLEKT
jgi:hypothetical protein